MPCFIEECPGTIRMHPDPGRCVCDVCGRRLPGADAVRMQALARQVLTELD